MQITVGVLKAATKYAAANGLLVRDPLAGFKRPRAESKTMDYWTAEQARQFLAYTRDGWPQCGHFF